MKRPIALALTVVFMNATGLSALGGHKAAYTGGTITRFNAAKERIEGRIDISSAHQLVFIPDGGPHAAQALRVDYEAIRHLEFGQKAGRRVELVVGATVFLGPVGLLSLRSKRRAHYLTVTYGDDEGRDQAAIFELGKSAVYATLATVEARSGVAIEYQDEEARKWRK